MPNDERINNFKRIISTQIFAVFVFCTAVVGLLSIFLPQYTERLEDIYYALIWVAELFRPYTPFYQQPIRARPRTPTPPPNNTTPEELPPLVSRGPTPVFIGLDAPVINGNSNSASSDNIYHAESPPPSIFVSPASSSRYVTAEEQQHGEQSEQPTEEAADDQEESPGPSRYQSRAEFFREHNLFDSDE